MPSMVPGPGVIAVNKVAEELGRRWVIHKEWDRNKVE